MADDAIGLFHLFHADQETGVAIAGQTDRHVEIHPVIDVIGLGLAQIPSDIPDARSIGPVKPQATASSACHRADIDRALFKDPVFRQQPFQIGDEFREALGIGPMSSARPAGIS